MLESFDLIQHVTEGTHNSGHILDLVITQSSDPIVTNIYNFFDLLVSKPFPISNTISYHSLKWINYKKFSDDINSCVLLQQSPTNICELSNSYNLELANILDIHAPLRKKDIVERMNSEWHTSELGEIKKS